MKREFLQNFKVGDQPLPASINWDLKKRQTAPEHCSGAVSHNFTTMPA